MRSIVVFFSRKGNNYVNGTIRHLPVGNTKVAARMIQEITGADMFELEPVTPYSPDYSQCIEEARQDQRRDARPELKAYPEHLEDYDVVYIGYPNYWGTMPMAVFTFLERAGLAGKVILPFCTHEGSGMGKSEKDIQRLCPQAKLKKGLAIHGAKVKESKAAIQSWIADNQTTERKE
mgnify:CR=1 FL=1